MPTIGFIRAQSLDQVMTARRGQTTGFDYLRIGLSLAVLVVHCLWLASTAGWTWLWSSWPGPVERSVLPAFFILSGFLVIGSLFRNTTPQFVALRLVRLIPALSVEVVLTALGLGLAFTTLPVAAYLMAPEFHAYFLNIIGLIHYTLPGVFGGKQLNVQLWTIPYELECYVMLISLALLGITRRRKLFLAMVVAGAVTGSLMSWWQHWPTLQSVVSGRSLVLAFLAGVAMYLFKDRVPYNKYLFLGACAATYLLFAVPHLSYLGMLPLAYATVYVGNLKLPRVPFGDLSYGVYLFHFPIAMTVHHLTKGAIAWWELTLIVTVLSGAFAFGSWTFIEAPMLRRKNDVLVAADRITARARTLMGLDMGTIRAGHIIPRAAAVAPAMAMVPEAAMASAPVADAV